MVDHIFNNVKEAIDYLEVENKCVLNNNSDRKKAPILARPITIKEAEKLIIPIDHIDYPYSAYFNHADTDKFIVTKLYSGRYCLKPNLRSNQYLYRGQIEYYDPCKPNLFRNPDQYYFIEECVLYQDLFLLILSHPLVQLLDLGVILNGRTFQFEMNVYGISQHYYNKTSCLDLTSKIDVASFFATNKYDSKNDTYVPITDSSKIGVLYFFNLDLKKDFRKQPDGTLLSTIGLQIFPRSGMQYGFLLDMGKNDDFNKQHQVSFVKFRHNADISKEINEKFKGGESLFPEDILSTHWKNYIKGEKRISENALRLNHYFNQNETLDSLRKKLIDNDYKIENYQPCFDQTELKSYYDDIKNGFWEVFCNKIHFPGDQNHKMKDDLLNLPNKDLYKWAFHPNVSHSINYKQGYLLRQWEMFLH